ncbi:MAG TPA: iron-containing alcohol dehydrogenase [Candidatus Binatia bacterium]|jgi:alcohol dehydrogenase|nr:iron-containing alcohol dehydrogenase [Candidatus Binatia bacterium]
MQPNPDTPPPSPASFDYRPRTRIVFGVNSVERAGELAREIGARNVLLVTDPGIVSAGHAGRVKGLLEAAGLAITCFDQVEENPTTRCVESCVEAARRSPIDTIIGLGGGSSMDTAKGCNFILTNGGRMKDYWGVGKAKLPMLPLIAIPTTGGTGSECQSFALITDGQTHQKMACGDPKAGARIAILDPALTLSQPTRVTACSGIDAIAHAVETAVTRSRSPLSLAFSREAFRLTMTGLPRVLNAPGDLEARGWMLLGAAWGGTAIENSMLGAAHSAANPLTAHFGIPHGHAVGLMLPHVVRFNGGEPATARAYAELAWPAESAQPPAGPKDVAEQLASRVEGLLELAGLSRSLKECGVKPEDIPRLAEEAACQWTAQFNPRPVATADFEVLYAAALEPLTANP